MRVAFIGGGVMGEIMLSAILDKGLSRPSAIWVSDVNETRLQHLKQKYGVTVTSNNHQAAEKGGVVVLAIKPQNLVEVMNGLHSRLKPEQLVLSIVAGARINTLSLGLSHGLIIRVMPNTPAQIGEGMSVWTASAEVTKQQREWAGSLLRAMGKEIYVAEEKYIDMATAVSGSGPAYTFLFLEALIDAAVHIGLPLNIAQELVLQTMLGSGHLVLKSGKDPSELRKMVTSPGGTTAEALLQLDKGGFSDLILQAVTTAYNKAQRLGN